MKPDHPKTALILSNRLIASHQIASILDQHGWHSGIMREPPDEEIFIRLRPRIVVADIDDSDCCGIHFLQLLRHFSSLAYAIALCAGGNTPEMRAARDLGVDGFFYLNAAGLALDPKRGLAPIFLRTHQGLQLGTTSHQLQPPGVQQILSAQ